MNVTVPRNDNSELWIFGVVLAIILCAQVAVLALIRYWYVNAKVNVRRRVKLD
jgi:Mg2+ and Co2+ transporter CorA